MAENKVIGWTKDYAVSWLLGKLWGLPIVAAVIYGVLAAIRGPFGPEVFLGLLLAIMVPLVSVAAIKGYRELEQGRAAIDDIKTLVLAHEEARSKPVLAPTIEMLEQSRRELFQKRERLIASWRAMVTEAHAKKQANPARTIIGVIEEHPSYLSLRPYLSQEVKDVIAGRLILQKEGRSTMSGLLHRINDIVDEMERRWQLI